MRPQSVSRQKVGVWLLALVSCATPVSSLYRRAPSTDSVPLLHNPQLQYCPQSCHFAGADPDGWTSYSSFSELSMCESTTMLLTLGLDSDPEHTRIKACDTTTRGPEMQGGAYYGLLNNNITTNPSPEIILSTLAAANAEDYDSTNVRPPLTSRDNDDNNNCGVSTTHESSLFLRRSSSTFGNAGSEEDLAASFSQLGQRWTSNAAGCGKSMMFARSGKSIVAVFAGADIANAAVGDMLGTLAKDAAGAAGSRYLVQACHKTTTATPTMPSSVMNSTTNSTIGMSVATLGSLMFDQRFAVFVDQDGDLPAVLTAAKAYISGKGKCLDMPGFEQNTEDISLPVTILGPGPAPDLSSRALRHALSHKHHHGRSAWRSGGAVLSARATSNACRDVQVVFHDTCTTLATKCGISSDDFAKYNIVTSKNNDFCIDLMPKQYVCCSPGVLPDHSPQPNADGTCTTYKVGFEEGCWAIADKFGITQDKIEDVNRKTYGFAGCGSLQRSQVICISYGDPPMPATDTSAVCGPTVLGTQRPSNYDDVPRLNPCPLNACCDVWGQCGTTADFCTKSEIDGHVGTAMTGTSGCISNCGTDIINNGAPPASFARVGYFEGWTMGRQCLQMDVTQISLQDVTHIHFAFAGISKDFHVTLEDGVKEQFEKFKAMDTKGVKKILSFGGWSFSTDYDTAPIFASSVSAANRQAFANNAVQFLKDNALDGLDFDWEYPGATDIPGSVAGSATDGANYLAFLQTVKRAMPTGKTLSIAIPASYWYLRGFPINKMATVVNYFVYMTYDLHGQWDAGSKWANSGCPTGSCLRSHVNRTETINALSMVTKAGARTNQIMMGVSSYGRSFRMQDPACTGPTCLFTGSSTNSLADKGACTDTAGYISYAELASIISQDEEASAGEVVTWTDQRSASSIMTWRGNWVAYMDSTEKKARTQWAQALNLGGTSDWAIDLQKFHDALPGSSTGENVYGQIVDCSNKYTGLIQLSSMSLSGIIPQSCWPIYTLNALNQDLQSTIQAYQDTSNDYDGKFGYYKEYIDSLVNPQLNAWMDNFNTDETTKKGLGNKYFDCRFKRAGEDFSWQGPCPVPKSAMATGILTDPEHDASSWTIEYTLRDQKGYEEALVADLGIQPSWVIWGRRDRWPYKCSSNHPTCEVQEKQWLQGNYPQKADHIDIVDPKSVWDAAMPEIDKLKDKLSAAIFAVGLGSYNLDNDPMDAAIALALPIQMLAQAQDNMAEVKEIGSEIEEQKKKEVILLILSVVFMVVPFLGEIGFDLAGLAAMARFAFIAGEVGNTALSVVDIIDDPSSVPMAVFGMLLGVAGRGKSQEEVFSDAVKAKNLMDGVTISKMGKKFKNMDDQLNSIRQACTLH